MAEKERLAPFEQQEAFAVISLRSRVSTAWQKISSVFTCCAVIWLSLSYLGAFLTEGPKLHAVGLSNRHHVAAPRPNIWRELSEEDLSGLRKYLHHGSNRLNLTANHMYVLKFRPAFFVLVEMSF